MGAVAKGVSALVIEPTRFLAFAQDDEQRFLGRRRRNASAVEVGMIGDPILAVLLDARTARELLLLSESPVAIVEALFASYEPRNRDRRDIHSR